MVSISKKLTADQVGRYHREQFASPTESYYSRGGNVGRWVGQGAEAMGVSGEVTAEQLEHLAHGRSLTGEQLIRRKATGNRAAWDANFAPAKSVSITALVGGDLRIRRAHEDAVAIAARELERFVQARLGGNHPAEATGKMVAAKFEHDIARPVEGYSAPQLHTHLVILNLTPTAGGRWRPLQEKALFDAQPYATAIYRSELAWRLRGLGYEVEIGKNHAPEIKGYSKEFLEAMSERRQQIVGHMKEKGLVGAEAAEIAAHQTREAKIQMSPAETLAQHREVAAEFGNQQEAVTAAALGRNQKQDPPGEGWKQAHSSLGWSRARNFERKAVTSEWELMRDALQRSLGKATFADVSGALASNVHSGELLEVEHARPVVGRAFTTPEMQALERENIATVLGGRGTVKPLEIGSREAIGIDSGAYPALQAALRSILESPDRIQALDGRAGTGKTVGVLRHVRDAAARAGFSVQGLAPTGGAAHQLAEAGIPSSTLQKYLARTREAPDEKTFFILDESSLASTVQVSRFLKGLPAEDRVLLVGDTRQHQAVEAGKPFAQLQKAGMPTTKLEEILRQKDPHLKRAVELLAQGLTVAGVAELVHQGRVHEVASKPERVKAIAEEYARQPEGTLAIAPDNDSRRELNAAIRKELQARGRIERREHAVAVLVPRQDLTGADRQWAARYEPGDVLRYSRASREHGIKAAEYARVLKVDAEHNALTVETGNGQKLMYDPRRLQGVSVYREERRVMAVGDRLQVTAPFTEERLSNRQLGTIQALDREGNIELRLDSGRSVQFSAADFPHLDYGFASTSYSAQGATVDRVLLQVESYLSPELVNSRLAYVGVSRAAEDVQLYTDNAGGLVKSLSREVSKTSALAEQQEQAQGISA